VTASTAELKQVERAARKGELARLELEAAIRAASAAGIGLRPIARAAGLSHEQIRRLIAKSARS
jgi:hypothetical protein